MSPKFSTAEKQRAIANVIKRSVDRMNNDETMKDDAERFGECSVAIIIRSLYGRLGDFHGSFVNGKFKVNIREQNSTNFDSVVTITEDAFMNLCSKQTTPEYEYGTGGIRVEGKNAYKIIVVGIGIGELLYGVLKD